MTSDNLRIILGHEPNAYGGKQDCVVIIEHGGQSVFNDIYCFRKYRFLCEAMNWETTSSKARSKVRTLSFYIHFL